MKLPFRFIAVACWALWAAGVGAQEQDCYAAGKVPPEQQTTFRSTVVLLDETVMFDDQQRRHIYDQLLPLVENGSEIRAVTFSAYLNGRYASPVLRVKVAAPLPDDARRMMRKDHLRAFDTCMEVAIIKGRAQFKAAIDAFLSRSSDKIAKSAILGTIKEVGEQVFPGMSGKSKRLVMVSDMLENSDVSSFYSGGGIRQIDAPRELEIATRKMLVTDLRGASVFVIGAGIIPATEKSANNYRSTSVMAPLKEFWRAYFEKSNAKLVDFGQPLLLNNLSETR